MNIRSRNPRKREKGGTSNGRRTDEGNPPDQHGQPQAGIPPAQDNQLAQPVQAFDTESVDNWRGGVLECDPECDPGSDHICAAGGTDREVK